jgi:hypothetical protein
MTPPTTISNPNFAPGVTTAITCQFVNNPFPPTGAASTGYFALLSLTGPGQLSAGTSTNSLGVTSIDPATLDFLSSSPFTSTSAVPEPATLGAALLGFAGLALARRRMSRANRP